MTQFPDSQWQTYGQMDQPAGPPRMSVSAVVGFISSLIFCCPLTSLVGLGLGVIGLFSVVTSDGRRRGAGFAIAAIVISLLSIVGQLMVWPVIRDWGAAMMQMLDAPDDFLTAVERDDLAAARALLHPDAQAVTTDEMLRDFASEIGRRYGTVGFVDFDDFDTVQRRQDVELIVTGRIEFNGAYFDYTATFLIDATPRPTTWGLMRFEIHDRQRGNLVFDPTGTSGPPPPSPPSEGDGEG